MLIVERSNRTERLLEGLASRLMKPGRDPLTPNTVVVQGPGMERWIAQSIARDYGILANAVFPFPRGLLDRVFSTLPDSMASKSNLDWEVKRLTWRIARHLAAGRDEPDFQPLARHLQAEDGDWRLVQLAHRAANLLDQYITFRPDWVSAWAKASDLPKRRDERWQARLYRDIRDEIGEGHVADRAAAFDRALHSSDSPSMCDRLHREFGDAIEIFAISTLPPVYLSVLDRLATTLDVHLSVLSPSRHYWADLWRELGDPSDSVGPDPAAGESGGDEPAGLFDGSSATPATVLLAGLGHLGGDFQRNLEESTNAVDGARDLFDSQTSQRGTASLLERLQRRILDLDDETSVGETKSRGESAPGDRIVSLNDDSIRIHICHGSRRELEVVEGCLREAFERDESLAPEDVLVMAPQIDEIAPDIVAVFGATPDAGQAIPYRIADRGAFRCSKLALAFRDLLALLGGRASRSEILDWLANEPVADRFGFDARSLDSLADWSERAGFRFGLDQHHRARIGLPRERAHTLGASLDRLALAHAVGDSDDVFAGLSATPQGPFGDPELLGALGEVDSILRDAFETITKPRAIPAWCSFVEKLLDQLFERSDANAHEHALIREVLNGLRESSLAAHFDQAIPFESIRETIGAAIESTPAAQPFLAGGVTFCELVPLRAIPFRVIVLMGMSDDAFPRRASAASFDLMASDRRPGDRTTRNDDRYLFLEALLSARDQLIMTVPGRDLRDGRDLPPSVVVSDLLEMLEASFELDPAETADHDTTVAGELRTLRDWLVVSHPLQASSPRYFETHGDPRLIGRDAQAYRGAKTRRAASLADGGVARRFLTAAEVDPHAFDEGEIRKISLDELSRRVLRSTQDFARSTLRLRLPRPEVSVDDLDPIEIQGLDRYGLGTAMLDMLADGATPERAARRLFADPRVPSGVVGRWSLASMQAEVETIARLAADRCSGDRLADRNFALDLDGDSHGVAYQLVGRLDQLWPGGRVQLGFTRIGQRGELELWIRHLVLCTLVERGDEPEKIEARSVYVGRTASTDTDDRVVVFEAVPDARIHLGRLCAWADQASRRPLPFFPRASRAFAEKAIEGKADQGRRDAQLQFEGGDGWNALVPESQQELETARIWEGWSPLSSDRELPVAIHFEPLAEELFEPLLAAREVCAR